MSQEALADAIGVSDTYIRKLKVGDRILSLETVVDLAIALNTTPDHLLLNTSALDKTASVSIMALLNDCTPAEFVILYENMSGLMEGLWMHLK